MTAGGPSDPPVTAPDRTGTLLQKTAGGAGWTIGWRAATRALGFISTLILARVLLPEDFGLVALAMSFSRAIDILADLSVEDALVRSTDPTRATYDTAFTINAISGGITALAIGLSAGLFADLLGDPRLHAVILVLALAVLIETFENVGVADFRRELAFYREFQFLILPRLAQIIVAITLASIWASYWALVAGILTSRVLQTIASYAMHPYRPRLSLEAWRDIAGFSFWSWLLGTARMVRERGVTMTIGGMLNPAQLGIFTVGSEIATLPETELIGPLGRACFAGFAAARRAGLSVAETYMRVVASSLVIAMPASIGISSVGAPLVIVCFGAHWQEAAPIVEIISAAGILAVVGRISTTLFSASGYLRPLFWNSIMMSAIHFALLVPFVLYSGIVGAAIASSLALLVEQSILAFQAFRRFAMPPIELLRRIWRCLLASAVMAAFLALSGLGWMDSVPALGASLRQLFLASIAGATVYAATLLGLWLCAGRPQGAETDVLELIRRSGASIVGVISRRRALVR